ncbi:MAG: hypothetical protein KDA91_10195 [Planctomycetaceae bacterium]|nr:hypothetical protein [Planctomycetaceae bacterium]
MTSPDIATVRDGRRFAVPRSRRLTWDLLYFNQQVPLCGHDRRMDLTVVASARAKCSKRVSWSAIFLKAFALVAADYPELRQTWYRWPWAHIYQNNASHGTLTVQRVVHGESWLFWGIIEAPETKSLLNIQRQIDQFCHELPKDVFRNQWRLAKLPLVLRRMIWWWNLNISTQGRAKRFGTFFLSTLAGRGAEIQVPPSIHTGCLTYGPLDENNRSRVTLAYDHRIMDGARVADILQTLEETLVSTICEELLSGI